MQSTFAPITGRTPLNRSDERTFRNPKMLRYSTGQRPNVARPVKERTMPLGSEKGSLVKIAQSYSELFPKFSSFRNLQNMLLVSSKTLDLSFFTLYCATCAFWLCNGRKPHILNPFVFSLAVGNEYGVALIDYVNRVCLLSTAISDLCGKSLAFFCYSVALTLAYRSCGVRQNHIYAYGIYIYI